MAGWLILWILLKNPYFHRKLRLSTWLIPEARNRAELGRAHAILTGVIIFLVSHFLGVKTGGFSAESVWCAPWRVDISGAVKARANELLPAYNCTFIAVPVALQVLALPGYALSAVLGGNKTGIMKVNGVSVFSEHFNATCVISIHPAFSLYNPSGAAMLNESIKKFKEVR